VPDGFSFTYKNRDIPSPYERSAYFDRPVAEGRPERYSTALETTSYSHDIRAGNFDVVSISRPTTWTSRTFTWQSSCQSTATAATSKSHRTGRWTICTTSRRVRLIPRSESSSSGSSSVGCRRAGLISSMTPWWQRSFPTRQAEGMEILRAITQPGPVQHLADGISGGTPGRPGPRRASVHHQPHPVEIPTLFG